MKKQIDIMNIIPYEEFTIDGNILKNLNEHYVNRKIKEYLTSHGVLPSSGLVESFAIPSNLMEEYKKYFYADYCRKEKYEFTRVTFTYNLIPDKLEFINWEDEVLFQSPNIFQSIVLYKLPDGVNYSYWLDYQEYWNKTNSQPEQHRIDNWLNGIHILKNGKYLPDAVYYGDHYSDTYLALNQGFCHSAACYSWRLDLQHEPLTPLYITGKTQSVCVPLSRGDILIYSKNEFDFDICYTLFGENEEKYEKGIIYRKDGADETSNLFYSLIQQCADYNGDNLEKWFVGFTIKAGSKQIKLSNRQKTIIDVGATIYVSVENNDLDDVVINGKSYRNSIEDIPNENEEEPYEETPYGMQSQLFTNHIYEDTEFITSDDSIGGFFDLSQNRIDETWPRMKSRILCFRWYRNIWLSFGKKNGRVCIKSAVCLPDDMDITVHEIFLNNPLYPSAVTAYGREIVPTINLVNSRLYSITEDSYLIYLRLKYDSEGYATEADGYATIPLCLTNDGIEEFSEITPWSGKYMRTDFPYYWPNGFCFNSCNNYYIFDESFNLKLSRPYYDTNAICFGSTPTPTSYYGDLYNRIGDVIWASDFMYYAIYTHPSSASDWNISIEKVDIEHLKKTSFKVKLPNEMLFDTGAIPRNQETSIDDNAEAKTLSAIVELTTYNQGIYEFKLQFNDYVEGQDNYVSEIQEFKIDGVTQIIGN